MQHVITNSNGNLCFNADINNAGQGNSNKIFDYDSTNSGTNATMVLK